MFTPDQNTLEEIETILKHFQDGYIKRNPEVLNEFMRLFGEGADLEVIGTGAIDPGDDEWCLGPVAASELIKSDWEGWGDLRLELKRARISVLGNVAWCAMPATVTSHFEHEESFQDYLDYLQTIAKDEAMGSAEERLMEILRGGTNTLFEMQRGETFVWPLRFTAVLVKDSGAWRFQQMQFSFATTRFPDVRLVTN